MQTLPVTTVCNGYSLLPVPCPGSRASQKALLGGKWAPHTPSKEPSESHCGCVCVWGGGWMGAQRQAAWESQSSKYL